MTPEGLFILLSIIAGLAALNVYLRVWLFMVERRERQLLRQPTQRSLASKEGSP